MATITINIDNHTESIFRKKVYNLYGKKKGTLGKAINEAMLEWSKKRNYFDTCMKLLHEGKDMGKLKYKSRDELHDRD